MNDVNRNHPPKPYRSELPSDGRNFTELLVAELFRNHSSGQTPLSDPTLDPAIGRDAMEQTIDDFVGRVRDIYPAFPRQLLEGRIARLVHAFPEYTGTDLYVAFARTAGRYPQLLRQALEEERISEQVNTFCARWDSLTKKTGAGYGSGFAKSVTGRALPKIVLGTATVLFFSYLSCQGGASGCGPSDPPSELFSGSTGAVSRAGENWDYSAF